MRVPPLVCARARRCRKIAGTPTLASRLADCNRGSTSGKPPLQAVSGSAGRSRGPWPEAPESATAAPMRAAGRPAGADLRAERVLDVVGQVALRAQPIEVLIIV